MKLSSIEVPEFGISQLQPIIEEKIFNERLDNLKEKLLKENYGCAIIYADREHFANMHYISNFDPRFEEAILIINIEEDEAILITGPENHIRLPQIGFSNSQRATIVTTPSNKW